MSLAEVLTAARALPREEQMELARTLTADIHPDPADGLPPAFHAWAASGQPLELLSPLPGAEAAAELLRLLAAERKQA